MNTSGNPFGETVSNRDELSFETQCVKLIADADGGNIGSGIATRKELV